MATLEELRGRRDALHKVRANGTRAVQHGDKRVEYRSDNEIAAAIADLDRQIAALTTRPPRIINIKCRRGY